ncbi:hypothetical protein [uncultured Aquimarina sp.]|uniref:hypothetical protein n=1 Tax=uncultured Aquimarina sp. TaxID=575652 RepID=UPI002639DAFB|nr:hypothetical protein [uncultured Aquimarina sp.]
MKNFRNLWMCASIAIGVFLIISCEKTEVSTETLEIQKEEFMNTTEYSDQPLDIDEEEIQEPVLHMSFDSTMDEETKALEWEKAVQEYIRKNPISNKTSSSDFFYGVTTVTGTGTHDKTNGKVMVSIRYNTDTQFVTSSYVNLDIPNVNDRQYGSEDFYLIRGSIPGQLISYVELSSAKFALQGKDGWVPKQLTVSVYPSWQIDQLGRFIPSAGYSLISEAPNVQLDNQTSSGWAYHSTGNIGSGRLTFF